MNNCKKTFAENSSIGKHIGQIHARQKFSCTDCTENFTGWDQSSNHMVKHEEASGPGKVDLEVKHKAQDETTRPAKEEVVELEALTVEDRTVHAGEKKKPLICNICGKMFTRNQALKRHTRRIVMTVAHAMKCLGK